MLMLVKSCQHCYITTVIFLFDINGVD